MNKLIMVGIVIILIVAGLFVIGVLGSGIVDEETNFPPPNDLPNGEDVSGYWGVDVWLSTSGNDRTRTSIFKVVGKPFWGVGYRDIQAYTLGMDLLFKGSSDVEDLEMDFSQFTTTFMISDASDKTMVGYVYPKVYPPGIMDVPLNGEYNVLYTHTVDIHEKVLEYTISNSGSIKYRKVLDSGDTSDWVRIEDIPSLTFKIDFTSDTISGSYVED